MEIFARPVDTRPGPTLMGRVLPCPIRNWVGYEFKKKKTRNGFGSGMGFIKKNPDPTPRKTRIKTPYPKLQKYPNIYIYL